MREHGTMAKYIAEMCRCEPCTVANRIYSRERARHEARVRYGIEAPRPAYIDATEARKHLLWLSSVGVGKRRVSELTGIASTTVWKIRTGRLTKCRRSTADKILAVGKSKAADGAKVDAEPTWRRIDELLKHGWTKTAIAVAIGSQAKRPALQLSRDEVSAKHARAIEELHRTALLPVIEERRMAAERRRRYRQPAREAA